MNVGNVTLHPKAENKRRAVAGRRVLVFSSTFPSANLPIHGVFVKERVRHVASLPGYDLPVVSPVPYFPRIRWLKRWYQFAQVARRETVDGLDVRRPRYLLLPKVGAAFHAASMAYGATRAILELQSEAAIDVIDAHFVFPDGVAASRLADRMRCPLVITARGEDILRFPELPIVGRQIRRAVKRADQLIAVSGEIAEALERQGAHAAKITVIPNGVDTDHFCPRDRSEARQTLGLPDDRPIVLSVGYLLERKGYHLLVDAIPIIRKKFPNVLVVIVGGVARWGQDYTATIEERIRANNVADHVRLVGPRPPAELPMWYSAADLFVLLSSREGCPNALLEALSCGLPSVGTSVGEMPAVLADDRLGVVLPERSATAAAEGIQYALDRVWDSRAIRQYMERRSWHHTAQQIDQVFDKVL